MNRLISCMLGGVLISSTTLAEAVELMHWERLPLPVQLVIDQERVVFVDRNVRVGVPGNVGSRLRVQTAAGAVYLRANGPLEISRIQLQDIETGEVILLDIQAGSSEVDQAPLEPIRIVQFPPPPESNGSPAEASRPTPIPVALTRYAAQNLYAPLRTIAPLHGIRLQVLAKDLPLDRLLPGHPVLVRPLAGWRLDDYRVSALLLRNAQGSTIDLDPRELQGQFFSASFQHTTLGPAGSATDTTVLYLVTHKQDLASALPPFQSRFDAALNLTPPETREPSDEK
ncbi:TIGR03749 family integrating conjugative element protein [Pseudomonas huaxiensis]|uniref:TIGR03749 family integrating conjugative element protein n=1 Tax=Pseudomonas huaxiensis TaxID=2213017 RepID=UPI000DA6C3B1|nr:TIGR03749 family integrating conjugative element protein [Pseudomonas huaxiensis]